MAQNTKLKKRILLKSMDISISILSVIIAYFLVGTVGHKTTGSMIAVAIIYLPICILFAMILTKGYEISLKKMDTCDFWIFGKALFIASILYLLIDMVMRYYLLVVCKLFSVILSFVFMILARMTYYLIHNKVAKKSRKKLLLK